MKSIITRLNEQHLVGLNHLAQVMKLGEDVTLKGIFDELYNRAIAKNPEKVVTKLKVGRKPRKSTLN